MQCVTSSGSEPFTNIGSYWWHLSYSHCASLQLFIRLQSVNCVWVIIINKHLLYWWKKKKVWCIFKHGCCLTSWLKQTPTHWHRRQTGWLSSACTCSVGLIRRVVVKWWGCCMDIKDVLSAVSKLQCMCLCAWRCVGHQTSYWPTSYIQGKEVGVRACLCECVAASLWKSHLFQPEKTEKKNENCGWVCAAV